MDDDFNSSTSGWGVTRFAAIGPALAAVDAGGTVNVAAGTYPAAITIDKAVRLLGAGSAATVIGTSSASEPIQISNTDDVLVSGFTITARDDETNAGVRIDASEHVTITNNHLSSGGGVHLINANQNTIAENSFAGVGSIFLSGSWSNHVRDNVLNVSYPGQIWLLSNSRNNVIEGNTIVGDPGNASCTGMRAIHSPNNLYLNNTTRGFRVHILLSYASESIVAGNDLSGNRGGTEETGGGILMYHTNDSVVINNVITDTVDGAITLFGRSSGNTIQANRITDSERGIELYYSSNDNFVAGNQIADSGSGIILDDTAGNRVYDNNVLRNTRQAYDDGHNSWSSGGQGNFWSDYGGADSNGDGIGDVPYPIASVSADPAPLMAPVAIAPVPVPTLTTAAFIGRTFPDPIRIDTEETWIGGTVELTRTVEIVAGGHLRLDNTTLYDRTGGRADLDPVSIVVQPGGTLEIVNTVLHGNGTRIDVEGTLIVTDSAFFGFGTWDGDGGIRLGSDGAVIENSVFVDAFTPIVIDGRSDNHQLTGNMFLESLVGLRVCCESSSGNTIQNNEIGRMINEAIFANGLLNSTVADNTVREIGDQAMLLIGSGPAPDSSGNEIYGNSFYDYGEPPTAAVANQWAVNQRGNYWDDYLTRYPDAQPHPSYAGVWDTAYTYVGPAGQVSDPYPLIANDLAPLAWTGEAMEVTPMAATLQGYVAPRDESTVMVSFEYRPAGLATWSETSRVFLRGTGAHGATPSDLVPDMIYVYRLKVLLRDGSTVLGEERTFRTGQTLAYFTATPATGTAPLNVAFDAQTKGAVSYAWDFGDGESGTGANPPHVYDTMDTYTVKLTVTVDGQTETLVREQYVHVWQNPILLPLVSTNWDW